jgi:hypothetical protein
MWDRPTTHRSGPLLYLSIGCQMQFPDVIGRIRIPERALRMK